MKSMSGTRALPLAALAVLTVGSGALSRPGPAAGARVDGWVRLGQAQLEAMAARSVHVRLGATEVVYHISPSGKEARVHYPSLSYSALYRRKIDGPAHCYHAAELPFTGWRCYSVWRKGGLLREEPLRSFVG